MLINELLRPTLQSTRTTVRYILILRKYMKKKRILRERGIQCRRNRNPLKTESINKGKSKEDKTCMSNKRQQRDELTSLLTYEFPIKKLVRIQIMEQALKINSQAQMCLFWNKKNE